MKKEIKQLNELKKYSKDIRLAAESWENDFEILISTIMSARTRDEVTIPIAEQLFKKFPNPRKLSKAKLSSVKEIIKPVNFYKNKSKNIINCSKELVENFDSKVPHDIDQLLTLSGVGRKTANVFLSEIGGDNIGVDTHVAYISRKLGWTKNTNAHKVEIDLEKVFPKKYWRILNRIVVRFGKTFTSRKKKDELLEKIRLIK